MKISDLPTKQSVSFNEVGDQQHPAVSGVIDAPPELIPDKFGADGERCLTLQIREKGVLRTLYARRQLLATIGDAVLAAGADEIVEGGHLTVWMAGQKPSTRGSIPQKTYGAHYESGRATLADPDAEIPF